VAINAPEIALVHLGRRATSLRGDTLHGLLLQTSASRRAFPRRCMTIPALEIARPLLIITAKVHCAPPHAPHASLQDGRVRSKRRRMRCISAEIFSKQGRYCLASPRRCASGRRRLKRQPMRCISADTFHIHCHLKHARPSRTDTFGFDALPHPTTLHHTH
jgi:hypothetical protein